MKIEATSNSAHASSLASELSAKKANVSTKDSGKGSALPKDSVSLGDGASVSGASSGNYSQSIQRSRTENNLQPMSELKNKSDERLRQFSSDTDTVESLAELHLDDDRQDMVEIARLRVKSGFYDRPEVLDEIARRIIEGV